MNRGGWLDIRFRIHLLFWAVIGLSVVTGHFLEVITLFVIVLIHELGHVAMARELGWTVKEVQLLPFGGVATMEDSYATDPMDEIVVALAGPFLNMVMMAASYLFWFMGIWTEEWARFFLVSNLTIALFNLLPIWPLDGGRILLAVLCWFMSYRQATMISMTGSTLFAGIMVGMSSLELKYNVAVIGIYLLVLNIQAFLRFPYQFFRFLVEKYDRQQEEAAVQAIRVHPEETVLAVSHKLRRGCSHLFYVQGAGLLAEEQLLYALLFEQKHNAAVGRLL
ncbi:MULTISPECIES: M50 family metallopeptidase [Brevibacillus]|uniref:M50 family metallopeptidase n=1 Tax=Brevibacillus TaxID=55080 RepID=UPI000D0F7134|nr:MULTISPECIES: M50 family metallopeptidase [Brevibacillus]PSJ66571.1 stage IV sporulation protein FB [Brevibacillus brevis]RED23992.1 stage IV sporulation protein FB [Brevibacillus brevis]GEC93422.1 stage IV sporulation protein FB [Brevibacillus brevis]VEF90350.1 Stage IV sporulation protein FB [Brevibacillus brevis]